MVQTVPIMGCEKCRNYTDKCEVYDGWNTLRRFISPDYNWRRCILHVLRGIVLIWMIGLVLGFYFTALEGEHKNRKPVQSIKDIVCTRREQFYDSFSANLKKLKTDMNNKSAPWIHKLGFHDNRKHVRGSFPVLVTAASRPFFVRSQGLIKSIVEKIMPVYPNLKFIFYDLDLRPEQTELIRKHCNCDVRRLPVDLLPPHVQKYQNYAFKPIIINLIYEEFGNVWWVDSSVRFTSRDLQLPLKYLREKGMLFFTYDASSNMAAHTDRRMFEYFNEDPCLYLPYGEVEASNIAFSHHPVSRDVLRLWLMCALDENCIAPRDAQKQCNTSSLVTSLEIGQCHRFDQSAISIILRRLYHKQNHYPLVEMPFRFLEIRRRENIPYFGRN